MNMSYWNNLTLEQKQKVKSYLYKIERLNNRIDKAIEYIRTNEGYSQISGMWEFYGDTDELVKILRGEEQRW